MKSQQRGFGILEIVEILVVLALAGAVIAAVHKAWTDYIADPYIAEGKADQIAVDQPKIDAETGRANKAEKERDNARSDTKACTDSAQTQNSKVDEWQQRALKAESDKRALLAAANRDKTKSDSRIRDLEAQAKAVPKVDQSCEAMRAKLRDNQKGYLDNRNAK